MNRMKRFSDAPAHGVVNSTEVLRNMQIDCQNYAYKNGIDKPEIDGWTWPENM